MEADLAFHCRDGTDLRHLYLPRGGPSRLTLRRLSVLVRHLPADSATARADGGHGFSDVELRVMELPRLLGGQLHPLHPARAAAEQDRVRRLRDRVAHYQQVGAQQAASTSTE